MTRLVWLLSLLWVAACGPVDVIIATLPDGGLVGGPPCNDDSACRNNDFCEFASCGGSAGHCVHRQGFCPPIEATECGCDGVTYLNGCERRAAGASFAGTGPCASGRGCSAQAPCPGHSACNRLAANACSGDTGVCWGVPPSCPTVGAFNTCDVPSVCLDFCQAVRTTANAKIAATAVCP
jgi:hypothetical protein